MSVGFVGLGSMGFWMAFNLTSGLKVLNETLYVWNRTKGKAPENAVEVNTISELAAKMPGVIFNMTFDSESLQKSFDELVSASFNGILAICCTIDPQFILQLQSLNPPFRIVGTPVWGRPDAAQSKQLICLISGDNESKLVVKPLLEMMGKSVLDIGEKLDAAHAFKVVGNYIIFANAEVLAEASNLAESAGIGRECVLEFINAFMPTRTNIAYGTRIVQEDFIITPDKPGFSVEG